MHTATAAAPASVRRFTARYDVTGVVDEPGDWSISATALLPHTAPAGDHLTVLCCTPGGGMSGQYFDLHAAGGGYSFAESAVAAGYGCVMVDILGTGNSTHEGDALVSPVSAARANTEAFGRAVRDFQRAIGGDCRVVTIGVGHSMGAMLTLMGQALADQHAAIVSLGFTPAGLPQTVEPDEADLAVRGLTDRRALQQLAARRFFGDGQPRRAGQPAPFPFFLRDTEPAALHALAGAATNVLRLPAMLSLLPGNVGEHIREITVPVFLGGAEHEPWHKAAEVVPAFAASTDISFFTLAGAAHNHNVAVTRELLWQRVFGWTGLVTRIQ